MLVFTNDLLARYEQHCALLVLLLLHFTMLSTLGYMSAYADIPAALGSPQHAGSASSQPWLQC
jgi:hypothetical protein